MCFSNKKEKEHLNVDYLKYLEEAKLRLETDFKEKRKMFLIDEYAWFAAVCSLLLVVLVIVFAIRKLNQEPKKKNRS